METRQDMPSTNRSTSISSALLFFAAGFGVARLFSMDKSRLADEARLKAQLEWRERSESRRQNTLASRHVY